MNAPEPHPDEQSVLVMARRAVNVPAAALVEWRMEPLARSATYTSAWRVAGILLNGGDPLPFAVVLKVCRGPLQTSREARVYASGFLDSLRKEPFGLIAPTCFRIEQAEPNVVWLWLEDVSEASGTRWSLDRYGLASYHLGRFNGGYPVDDTHTFLSKTVDTHEISNYPWLGRGFLPDWIGFLEEEGIGDAMFGIKPEDQRALENPLVQHYLPPQTQTHLQRLWKERHLLLAALAGLPRTLAHGDAHRRNLLKGSLTSAPGGEITIGVDWDSIGLAPLGQDPGHLVSSSQLMEADARQARELDRVVFKGYLEGLKDAGWQLDQKTIDLIRFGYTLHTPLNMGFFAAGGLVAAFSQEWLRLWLEDLLNQPLEAGAETLGLLANFTLELADEAEALGHELGLLP